ncbi:PorP/SprF family type IX secretion system membrane protein [Spongiivirga citrea]|uniref:Type IX secretion system membrane protein PorP/SprF n=1 Tax=Spongiivirga citrea TaxID=1481457 RepID=A0A6M0CJN5_9FLAO|nr:type IX secretion system membrane protein PorP/SprF [Spongiivirga citrea]NER18155.1 type IX secretion system membrane protein PorP/SprF [Spongiivirga citrea]
MRLKLFFCIVLTFSALSRVNAQQDAQYTQYMYNTVSVNPAYAGSRGYLSITGLYRSQWVGFDGAPETQTLTLNSPVAENVGFGLSIVNDKIGPSNETYFYADFAYTLRMNSDLSLNLGLKAGGNLLDVDFSRLEGSEIDPRFQNNIDNRFSPNVGVGAFLYGEKGYVGVSVPNLLETNHFDEGIFNDDEAVTLLAKERANLYLIGGYVFDLDYFTKLKPTILTKMVQGAPLQVDLSVNVLFNDKVRAGLAYRWGAAISGMAGFQINDSLLIGYAYDAELTTLGSANSGSHEIFLRFELFRSTGGTLSPRFF